MGRQSPQRLAPGSHASASTPAPTSRQPAAERETASPRDKRDPIKAPAGRAVTGAAAADTSAKRTPDLDRAADERDLPLAGRRGGGHARARTDQGQRHLDDEDRGPVEGLGERATQCGADRGAEHCGPDPQVAPRCSVRVQEREGGHQTAGSSRCLQGATYEEGGHIVRPGQRPAGGGRKQDGPRPHACMPRAGAASALLLTRRGGVPSERPR